MAEIESKANAAREYITFRIGSQYYCIDIMSVREIRGWTPATALPRAPGYVRGVINLRGVVLPIIDLADRLGFEPTEPTQRHVIIVAQTGKHVVGLLVDAVSDIIAMPADKVQPTPDVGSEAARAFVLGVMAIEDRMISLIALESVMPTLAREAA
ncbi:MAG TPA: chemotaxis protein CheW [Roseiarcus sp.]|nr:chemotaxis protein CheW [Roseiarcus sp.]